MVSAACVEVFLLADDDHEVGFVVGIGEVKLLRALSRRAHAGDDRINGAGVDSRNEGVPLHGVDLELQAQAVCNILSDLHVVAVGIEAALAFAADGHGAKGSAFGIGPVIGLVGALHADLERAGRGGRSVTVDGELRHGAAGGKRHDLLHELGALLICDLGQNGVDLVAQGVALLQADGNADIRGRCGKARVVVLERQVGQIVVRGADGKRRRLFGNVAVDRAALKRGQKVGEFRIGARLNVRDLLERIGVEGARLRGDLRAGKVCDGLGIAHVHGGGATVILAAAAAGEARHTEHDGQEDGYDSSHVCLHFSASP